MFKKVKNKKYGCTNPLCSCEPIECINYACSDCCNCQYSMQLKTQLFDDDKKYFEIEEQNNKRK